MPELRLGIDVGGTFTDVVAIDAQRRTLVAFVKVPTTHHAPEGVAAGIVEGIRRIFAEATISPDDVRFIAHSTTQATNALLEGDVARVGVIGLAPSLAAFLQLRFAPFDLAPGKRFAPQFLRARDIAQAEAHLATVKDVDAIAVSSPFGVDVPDREDAVVRSARARGLFATAGHEVSTMYGLRARTRTAAVNAAILPRMTQTARMTEHSVRDAGVRVALMVMRSDGGVMDVAEIERRPILTLLSGPAAGVAGALLHENVTDGIFIEVGGTSSDCSAIRNGLPQLRPARIGGHRTMLRTLDVRTLAVGGGSMIRAGGNGVVDVGPRSAHIAGLPYACFCTPERLDGATVERIAPASGDPSDYVVLRAKDGERIAVTLTCAANAAGEVPIESFARANAYSALRAMELVAREAGGNAATYAHAILECAAAKLDAAIHELIEEYQLDPSAVVVVGGGGGAGTIVPFVGKRSRYATRLARNAEVISPIGVALALVRDVVERTIVDPSAEQILALRREAQDRVVASGAAPESIEALVEIDAQRNLVRVTASGSTRFAEDATRAILSENELHEAASSLMNSSPASVTCVARTRALSVWRAPVQRKSRFLRREMMLYRVLDERGVGRLTLRDALVVSCDAAQIEAALTDLLERATSFGDVGRAIPELYVLHGARVADFTGLASTEQCLALAKEELAGRVAGDAVVLLAAPRLA